MEQKPEDDRHRGPGKLLRAFTAAFSIYSKIPMPHFAWGSEDMEYHLIFFPFVGLVTGFLLVLLRALCGALDFSEAVFSPLAAALPLLVTGGFHFDGYLDTMDAVHSYGSREKKLEILSDPHIGAFALCWGIAWGLLSLAGYAAVYDEGRALVCMAAGFVLSRALSGIGVVTIPSAKSGGMLQTFASTARKQTVLACLLAEAAAAGVFLVLSSGRTGLAVLAAGLLVFVYYRHASMKEYGGITGDLAGWFVTVSELVMLWAAAITAALGGT